MVSANDKGERKVSSLRDLPRDVQPPRDLWSGIEAHIAADRRGADRAPDERRAVPPGRASRLRWIAAAAVVAALAVGMWIGRSLLPTTGLRTGLGGDSGTSARVSTDAGAPEVLQAAYVTDPKYRRQREALVKSLEAQLAALPPDSRAKVIASLATIHKSMQDLQAALGRDPSNALLQELLVNTYQDEMRVLTVVHEASDAGKGI
jgi:hypothetical protein